MTMHMRIFAASIRGVPRHQRALSHFIVSKAVPEEVQVLVKDVKRAESLSPVGLFVWWEGRQAAFVVQAPPPPGRGVWTDMFRPDIFAFSYAASGGARLLFAH